MTIVGISSSLSSSVSATIASTLSNAIASVGEDGIRVTISQNATDALNLLQDLTSVNISIAALKSVVQSEQAVVKMIQDSVDKRV